LLSEPAGVLYVIDQLCEAGGAERVLLSMLRSMPPDRFACRVLTFKIDRSLPLFASMPCPVHVLPLRRTFDLGALRTAWELRRLLREYNIQVAHTFFETSDLWAGPILKLAGCPVLISSRRDMGILRSPKHRIAYKLLGRVYDEVQTVSNEVREFCIRHDGLDPRKVRTVYNGASSAPARNGNWVGVESLGLEGASHVITKVAHIRRVKGVDVFLRAAARLRREFPRALFLVVGEPHDTDAYSEVLEIVKALDLEGNVRFVAGLDDVYPVLERSDVFCMLSRSEGLSNAILEAMVCGLPCVATRVGGNPELVRDGENGFLVENEDDAAAARRIAQLLHSREQARAMGQRSRLLVEERFTAAKMVETLMKSYDSLLDKR
jgi:glycosyltransferase involved in cell wall biosynthesis